MKPQGLLATMGFGLAVAGLYVYSGRAHEWSGQLALVLTAMAAWGLESQAVPRKPVDFSTGFLFYLMLALSGDAVGASMVMLAGYCVREVANRDHTADLLWLTPVMAGLAVAQSTGNWPAEPLSRSGLAVVVTVVAAILMGLGSKFSTSRLEHGGGDLRAESRQRALRRLILLYAPAAALLPPDQAWMMTTVAPLCLALQRSAENIGYRPQGQESETRLEARLAKPTEQQLEEMTAVFAGPLTASQAFRELTRVTSDVVEYRSLVLFKIDVGGKLNPLFHSSPDPLTARDVAGKREPLVEKAWQHDRAYRGAASAGGQRMLAKESQLVAIPLKPAGVLYFGRDHDQSFSKAEASKLLFVVRRAAPALLRAEEEATC